MLRKILEYIAIAWALQYILKMTLLTLFILFIGILIPTLTIVHFSFLAPLNGTLIIGAYLIMGFVMGKICAYYQDPPPEYDRLKSGRESVYLGMFLGQITFITLISILWLPNILQSYGHFFVFMAIQETTPFLLGIFTYLPLIDTIISMPLMAIYCSAPWHWVTAYTAICSSLEGIKGLPAKGLIKNKTTCILTEIITARKTQELHYDRL